MNQINWNVLNKTIFTYLLIGLVIRLILIPITTSPFDVSVGWTAVIQEIYAGNSLYDAELYKYTPVWGYILSIIAYVANILGMSSFGEMFTTIYTTNELTFAYGYVTNMGFNTLLKMPMLIFDILTAFAIYRLVMDIAGDKRKSEISFALWFLCPLVIASSSILCMFDNIMIYFMVESIIFFKRKNMLLAGIFIVFSILTKVFSVLLIPLMISYILSDCNLSMKDRLKKLTTAICGGFLAFMAVYAIPIMSGEFIDSLWFLTSRVDTYSGGGFSISSPTFNNIFFYMPIIVCTIILSCIIMILSKENRDERFNIMVIVTLSLMFCFPFVAYTPQYGLVLLLPIVLLYIMKRKIALIPWFLTIIFVIHGILYYWGTLLLPLGAFTDLLDITSIDGNMQNSIAYYLSQVFMSAAGFTIMVAVLWYYVIPFIKKYRSKVVKTR